MPQTFRKYLPPFFFLFSFFFFFFWFHISRLTYDLFSIHRFGISFLGDKFTEAKLLGMAYAFEQKTQVRDKVQPYLVPKSELGHVIGRRRRRRRAEEL